MTAVATARERPILFSGEMVRAILEGKKTQTRRVLDLKRGGWGVRLEGSDGRADQAANLRQVACGCPHGQPGDRLWVREAHRYFHDSDWCDGQDGDADTLIDQEHVRYEADLRIGMRRDNERGGIVERVTYLHPSTAIADDVGLHRYRRRPSRFMPRWASRLTLEITNVSVSRLQHITGNDAADEGVKWASNYGHWPNDDYDAFVEREDELAVDAFRELWDSLNAKRGYSWDLNPWVWVIEFKPVEG